MLSTLSGEFILKFRPNGGTTVLLRTCIITSLVYIVAIIIKARLAETSLAEVDVNDAKRVVSETIPWFGAIFAGVYAALYARFASQWTYLATLYNEQMAAAVANPPIDGDSSTKILRMWQAGFIEDAEDLHLAQKPLFASIIQSLLARDAIRDAYVEHTPGGLVRLALLEQALAKVTKKSAMVHQPKTGSNCPCCGQVVGTKLRAEA
jgi:hypothetical protein